MNPQKKKKKRRWESISAMTRKDAARVWGGRRRQERREHLHLIQMWVQLWCGAMWCDSVCSHCRAGNVQRLHNPGFSWHTAPPAFHLSISLSLSMSGVSTLKQSRHRWSAALHTWTSSLGRAGRVSKGKSDRESGSWCEHDTENG